MVPLDVEGRLDVLNLAQKGDKEVLPALQAMFEGPKLNLAVFSGELAAAENPLVRAASGKNFAFKEWLARRVRALRDDMA